MCAALLEKVTMWQLTVAQEQEKQMAYVAERSLALQQRLHKQQEMIESMRMQQPVATYAIKQAEKKLTKEFYSDAQGEEYINSVLNFLEHQ